MKCPACKANLIPDKMLALETLDEHIMQVEPSVKQSYVCPNTACQAYGTVLWNDIGEMYCQYSIDRNITGSKIQWIGNNSAPFGTFQRKCNVEIYKHDEDFLFCMLPWPMKGWKVYVKYHYSSNDDGDILSRRWGLEWVRPDHIIHMWGYRMVLYGMRRAITAYRQIKNGTMVDWYKNELARCAERQNMRDAEWWRYVNAYVAKVVLWMCRNNC